MRPAALVAALLLLATGIPTQGAAQIRISGQVDLTARSNSDPRGLNLNFRGDSPFSEIRTRLFARHWLTDRIGVFTEVLLDNHADVRLNGAYVVVNRVAGREWLDVRAGLAPSPIGSFGLRSTYFNANPLVGVPLVWQHRTTLGGSGLVTADDLLRRRRQNVQGVPMLYDSCWNLQWEAMGRVASFEYSLAVTPGSVSNPPKSMGADGVQVLARVGVEPTPGFRLGASGAVGPYIGGATVDPEVGAESFPGGPEDYDQRLFGVDLEASRGKIRLLSEAYVSTWEAPLVAEDLTAVGGFVELRYDFLPRWFGAVRTGAMTFSEIEPVEAGGGAARGWDDDVLRVESALTYRWSREVHVRLNWQRTEFLTGTDRDRDLVALQLRAVF